MQPQETTSYAEELDAKDRRHEVWEVNYARSASPTLGVTFRKGRTARNEL
jgi:hypothetical protein